MFGGVSFGILDMLTAFGGSWYKYKITPHFHPINNVFSMPSFTKHLLPDITAWKVEQEILVASIFYYLEISLWYLVFDIH